MSLESYFSFATVVAEYAKTLLALEKYDECYLTAERYVSSYRELDAQLFSIFQKCAERSTPKYVANWSDVFSYYPARIGDFINSAAGETRLNYEKLYYMLKSKNIKFILMQYPKCSIQFLKNIFSPHQQDKITFVENFNNFSKELATKQWDEVFLDKYSIVFGHTTELGASLIANSAAKAVRSLPP